MFERMMLWFGVVLFTAGVVGCVVGCGGAEFTAVDMQGVESEAGSGDANSGVYPEAGEDLRDSSTDGMAPLLHDASPDTLPPPDAGLPDALTDSSTACDGALGLLCATDDPGPGIYCHNFGGSWCVDLDGGCGAIGSSCRTVELVQGMGTCAGHVTCR